MVASMPAFRMLFHRLVEYEGNNVYHDVILPWQSHALNAMNVLQSYGSVESILWNKEHVDACSGGEHDYYSCLEHLYALSRVSDMLLLPFQPVRKPTTISNPAYDEGWMPLIKLEERNEWLRSLGMSETSHPTFHPFYHEIVEVDQTADPDEPISLVETFWPGFLLGHMLFCRAGVRVRGGENFIRKDIAENSRLYWTYTRNNRQTVDLSHGWGHNSQWGTDFRRDYVTNEAYYYNVDGEYDIHEEARDEYLNGDSPHLTLPQRIELLTNRCFIITPERFYDEEFWSISYRELQ
jgi:hypothetical protein